MHFLLHLRLQGFYTRIIESEYEGRPLVVHRDKRVLDANRLALSCGIEVGMGLAEARAVLENGAFVRWQEEPYRQAQSDWLDVCAEYTDVIEPLEQHTALLDLSEHPNPRQIADTLIRALGNEHGFEVSAGTGSCRWVAELASSFNIGTEPILKPGEFLKEMSTHCLAPVLPEHRDRLVFLGYTRVGDVAKIPLEVLRAQFGDPAYEIFRAARGGGNPEVQALWPHGCLTSRMSFDGAPEDIMTLRSGFDLVAEQLAENLEERGLQGSELQIFLEHEDGSIRAMSRTFSKAARSRQEIAGHIGLMLAEPPEIPVVGVRVRMTHLERAKRIQLAIDGCKSRYERELSASNAFEQIRKVFGDRSILVAGQAPEPRRRSLLRFWKQSTGWV